jgi:ribonucleotide monophosphatase NagD (HAD superfamily)
MYLLALDDLGENPGPDIWMIGDRLDTDLRGARTLGLTGILVLTGITETPPSLEDPEIRVVPHLEALEDLDTTG